jgi:uncharacterized protein YdaU (DUF1376 family)
MKDPAFLFYSSDWLTGCQFMSMNERGEYITLLAAQHQNGHLDPKRLGFLLGYGWDMVSDIVKSKFVLDENGLIYNERLEAEAEKRSQYADKQRNNGMKGGRPKKDENPKETQTITQLITQSKPKNNPTENENENVNRVRIEDNKKVWFDVFWEKYNKKQDSKKCLDKWLKLSDNEINAALDKVDEYVHSTPDVQFRKNPLTWLNGKCWEDEIITPMQLGAKTKSGQALERNLAAEMKFDLNGNAIL